MEIRAGETVELSIESLASGGDGVARHEGLVVFVSNSAPGDRLRCQIDSVQRRFLRAHPVEILEPGPGRRKAPCRYFERCGGCDWLHLKESVQSEARRQFLNDALTRIGGFASPPEIEWLPSGDSLEYRAVARFAVERGKVGFRARGSHEVVDIEHCAVLSGPTQAMLRTLRMDPPARPEVEIRGFDDTIGELRASRRVFVQANQSLWKTWPARVAELCGQGSLLVELYAGIGFFTAAVEPQFKRVIAVERSRAARDLRHNTSAEVHETAAETFALRTLPDLAPDVVLLNPPRVGCDAMVIDAVAASATRRVVYVSCDAATLARDLQRLRKANPELELKRVISVDALPQTAHVEAVVLLDMN